ncbi:MAG: cyclic nucleotide-binding domain-containing protein, partial [Candidatus Tectomicrobia bacterium]|nr:cyclic nucleotide-binding domain-containing protein [Candidatus Tectomicrobia bacterium]
GMVDGLTTGLALILQLFVVPWCLRRLGLQGTNLLYPLTLLLAFAGLACTSLWPALLLPAATFARFTRSSLLPTLRGTTFTLMLNAAPRKTVGIIRNFNTSMVLPLGQSAGALLLMLLKSLGVPWLWPTLGLGLAVLYLLYAWKQNTAYSTALLEVLRADRVHLLDLEEDNLRNLPAEAVAAISARLQHDDDEARLAAIALLQSSESAEAYAALRAYLPTASPESTAAVLTALATSNDQTLIGLLRPYLDAPQASIRLAALAGLRRLGDTALPQHVLAWLHDPEVQVRAAAITLALTLPNSAEQAPARQRWEAMLQSTEAPTLVAALSIFPNVPDGALQSHVTTALDHPDLAVRCAALQVLQELAHAQRLTTVDAALLRALAAAEVEVRHLALQVLTALGTDEALSHILTLLDDDQPQVRDTLTRALYTFGARAIAPLAACLRAPQTSLLAKTSALIALARLHGTDAEQLLPFWEAELREVYQYKLLLTCLEATPPNEADAFLRAALHNAYTQLVSLLVQVVAVWSSPEVARLVELGLHDTDRNQRASALEALESLGQRRFTRFLLPILLAENSAQETWRSVAQHQWHLAYPDLRAVLEACIQSPHPWIVMGALIAGQARATAMGPTWAETLAQYATTATDVDLRTVAQQLQGTGSMSALQTLRLPDLLLFLKRIPLCSSMSLEQLRTVAYYLTERHASAGEVIFREGDASYDLYMIVSGQVDIVQQRGGHVLTLVTLSQGDFFGDMALLGDHPRSAGAVAIAPTRLVTLSPEHFRQVIIEDPAISFEIFRVLSARIRRFDEAMIQGTAA